jgi:hypothetical protein
MTIEYSEAQKIANCLYSGYWDYKTIIKAAAELNRLHYLNKDLIESAQKLIDFCCLDTELSQSDFVKDVENSIFRSKVST